MADIELTNVTLGLQPFVLLEGDIGADDELKFDLSFGGSVDTAEQAAMVMVLVLAELAGVNADSLWDVLNSRGSGTSGCVDSKERLAPGQAGHDHDGDARPE